MAKSKRQEAADSNPNVWIAVNEGDTLDGVVIDVDTAWSDQRSINGDGWYPLLTVTRIDNGKDVKWHAFETVAMNEVLKRRPIPGERITVTYEGEGEPSKKGMNPPKIFRLRVHGRDPVKIAEMAYGRFDGVSRDPRAQQMQAADVSISSEDLAQQVLPGAQFGDDPAF